MLKIRSNLAPDESVELKLAGQIRCKELDLLEAELTRWLHERETIRLDLEGVQFIDDAGLILLKRYVAKGVALQGGSLFVGALLRSHRLIE